MNTMPLDLPDIVVHACDNAYENSKLIVCKGALAMEVE